MSIHRILLPSQQLTQDPVAHRSVKCTNEERANSALRCVFLSSPVLLHQLCVGNRISSLAWQDNKQEGLIVYTRSSLMTESHSNITLQGMRNTGLTSLDVVPYIYGLSYETIGEILQLTPAYKSIYDADMVPEEHHDAYYSGEWMEYYNVPDVNLIRGSLLQPNVATPATNKGLVGTVLAAFNTHQNLQFWADDIWISILAQFTAYINGRGGKELRSKIVDFEGQKALEVTSPGNIYSANYGAMNLAFLEKIAANIKDPTLRD
jgi:hypothetical protein